MRNIIKILLTFYPCCLRMPLQHRELPSLTTLYSTGIKRKFLNSIKLPQRKLKLK